MVSSESKKVRKKKGSTEKAKDEVLSEADAWRVGRPRTLIGRYEVEWKASEQHAGRGALHEWKIVVPVIGVSWGSSAIVSSGHAWL